MPSVTKISLHGQMQATCWAHSASWAQSPATAGGQDHPPPGQPHAWWSGWHSKSYVSCKEPLILNCFVFKVPPSVASRCFLPCNIKHKSSHKKHGIKMRETQFLLCTTLGNYNNTSPLFLNKQDIQSSNERCSRCGNKVSHFLHPACATSHNWVTVDYKISSEVSGFGPLQTHIHGEWPETTAYCHKNMSH